MLTELDDDLRLDPARPARRPVGHQLRVRHARRRHADVVRRPPVEHRRAARAARAQRARPTCSSATTSATATSATTASGPYDAQPLVEIANALSLSLGRSLDWIHLPVQGDRVDVRFFETLGQLALRPETQLYLGLLHPRRRRRRRRRRASSPRSASCTTSASPPTAGGAATAPRTSRRWSSCTARSRAPLDGRRTRPRAVRVARRLGPRARRDWTHEPVDAFGTAYDNVDRHGWYRNLDPTVEELAHLLGDGDIMIDYSGGTGILLDRLKLRMFDTQVGAVIVDSSPKFLRVALEKFRDDPKVGFRLLRFLKDEKRLATPRRGARARAARARRRRHRVDERHPPLPRPGRHRRVVAAGAAPRRPRAHQLGQHPQPAGPPQRVDPRRDGVGRRRPRRGPRAHRSGVRRLPPPTSTTPSG